MRVKEGVHMGTAPRTKGASYPMQDGRMEAWLPRGCHVMLLEIEVGRHLQPRTARVEFVCNYYAMLEYASNF